MTAPTVFAAVSLAPLPHHVDAAEVYVRACHADRHLTQGRVAELAYALASRPEWQQAIDADRADLLQRVERLTAENRALRDANGHQARVIVGAIATIRNAKGVGQAGHSADALGQALLVLESSLGTTDH